MKPASAFPTTARAHGMRAAKMRVALGFATALGLGSAAAIALYVRLAPLPRAAAAVPSRILGDRGAWVADVNSGSAARLEVALDQVPPDLIHAVVDVEDQAFFSHHGINVRGISRALLANVTSGRVVQGGSSITQQLAKNLFLTNDRTVLRKFRELLYALQLETRYDKKQILQRYLNVIYLGDGVTGVGAAAWHYFGRPVGALDLAQCAMLAGLPRGPELYSPVRHPRAAKIRQLQVLRAMLRQGSITPRQMLTAWREPLAVARARTPRSVAPYFTDAVERALDDRLAGVELAQAGYSVQTGLNLELQRAVNAAITRWVRPLSGLQVAVVVQNAQTGDILAYSGGRDYRTSPYDRVRALRQPGSSFKPFVYSAALQHGWTETRTVMSAPTTFTYGDGRIAHWRVHNYADTYAHRPIDMKTAVSKSDNVYAVAANLAIGPERVQAEARQLGLAHTMEP
ncbi:MAG: transglycosylase domain-containing protein, partial [Firmicutes bacterium]|nr:transglycosylase domain-containing protein [Bacillota bacterium]